MQRYRGEIPKEDRRRPLEADWSARGSGLVEYALILVLVAVVSTAALALAGPAVKDTYCDAIEALNPNVQACPAPEPEPGEEPGGPSIRDADYNPDTQQLHLHAHATEGYEGEMYVVGYGGTITMEHHGETFCFRSTIAIPITDLPLTLQIGSSTQGWTIVELNP